MLLLAAIAVTWTMSPISSRLMQLMLSPANHFVVSWRGCLLLCVSARTLSLDMGRCGPANQQVRRDASISQSISQGTRVAFVIREAEDKGGETVRCHHPAGLAS